MSEIIALKAYNNGTDYRRMARAIRYLSEHYAEQPKLEDAASAVGLSPFHFQRIFTRYVGVSPKAFVGHLTLDHAKRELRNGASVLEAALDAGLSGPSRLHDLSLKIEAMTPGEFARGGAGLEIAYGFHDSPFGIALIMTTAKGVCGTAFGNEGEEHKILDDMKARWPKADYREDVAGTAKIARRIFDPSAASLELSLHLIGTPWQVQVWQALLAIPEGGFASYADVARALGKTGAGRAVGAAVGRNPVSFVIPCHRVLGSGGALTGYHWGVDRKRAILAWEAARGDQERPRTSAIA